MSERDPNRVRLERELAAVNKRLEQEMLARGFDPQQVDNIPLDNELGRLYSLRLDLMERLEQLSS